MAEEEGQRVQSEKTVGAGRRKGRASEKRRLSRVKRDS